MEIKKKYSILTFIMNDYEMIREPLAISENAEYILVTDNKNLTSKTWKIVYIPNHLSETDGFTKSFYVRYHPFEFVNTDICIVLDGSILIKKSLDKLIDDFISSKSDISLMIHWNQINAKHEYGYWIRKRNYDSKQKEKAFAFMNALGYSSEYKGAFEAGFKICRNDRKNSELNEFVYESLVKLGKDKNHIERVDQGILTAIVNTNFTHLNIFPVTHQILQNSYMQFFNHKSLKPFTCKINYNNMYLFNKPVKVYELS